MWRKTEEKEEEREEKAKLSRPGLGGRPLLARVVFQEVQQVRSRRRSLVRAEERVVKDRLGNWWAVAEAEEEGMEGSVEERRRGLGLAMGVGLLGGRERRHEA